MFIRHLSYFLTLLSLLFGTMANATDDKNIDLLLSIKPLALIASSLITADDKMEVLIDPNQSPHTYHAKPSDIVKIKKADMIVWIGVGMESNMAGVITRRSNNLELAQEIDGINQQDYDSKHKISTKSVIGDHNNKPDSYQEDYHIWLSPELVNEVARAISMRLQQINPTKKQEYEQKLTQFVQDLQQHDALIKSKFAQLSSSSFIAMHDGLGLFAGHYNLDYLGYILSESNSVYRPQQLIKLKEMIAHQEVNCIVIEPQYNAKVVDKLLGTRKINQITIDILATRIKPTEDAYFLFMNNLADDMIGCLS